MFGKNDVKKEYKFLQLLDLDPHTEKSKFDNNAVKELVLEKPSLCRKEYQFKCHARKISPLIMAYLLEASEDVKSLIRKAHPQATESCPAAAIIAGENLEAIEQIVSANPILTGEIICGFNIIHLASIYHASFESLEFLCRAQHPRQLKKKDENGCTPLLLACQHHSSTNFIRLLIDKAPTSVQILNLSGASPLHLACAREDSSVEIITLLTEVWPIAVVKFDADGNCPLHLACISNAPEEVIKYLADKSPAMLDKKNNKGDLPYFIAKTNDVEKEAISFLGVSSFNRKLMEEDDRSIIFKIDELILLISDVHVMKLFYTFVNISFRLDHIDETQRNHFMKNGLAEAAKTTCCTPSSAIFKVILQKALDESIIPILTFHELDRDAEITHTASSAFISDMWSHINRNTARIERLEDAVDNLNDNVRDLHKAVERLRNAMVERIKADQAVFYMKVVFTVCGLGIVTDAFQKMGECVDFGSLQDLQLTFPDNPVLDAGINAGLTVSNEIGEIGGGDFSEMMSDGSKYMSASQDLLSSDKAWTGALFSLGLCAGIANRKTIQAATSTKGFEFDINQVEVAKLSGHNTNSSVKAGARLTLAERVKAIENEVGTECPDVANILEKVKYLEKCIIGEECSTPMALLLRLQVLEESVFG